MSLKSYFPISLAFFAGVLYAAHYYSAPILPFALILLAGETLLGFQLEEHRIPKFLGELFKAPKTHAH